MPGATLAYFGAEVVKVRVSQAAADGLLLHNRMLQVPQVVSWFTDTRYFELLHSLFIVWFITGGCLLLFKEVASAISMPCW